MSLLPLSTCPASPHALAGMFPTLPGTCPMSPPTPAGMFPRGPALHQPHRDASFQCAVILHGLGARSTPSKFPTWQKRQEAPGVSLVRPRVPLGECRVYSPEAQTHRKLSRRTAVGGSLGRTPPTLCSSQAPRRDDRNKIQRPPTGPPGLGTHRSQTAGGTGSGPPLHLPRLNDSLDPKCYLGQNTPAFFLS